MAAAVFHLLNANQDFVIFSIQLTPGFVVYLISFVAEIVHAIRVNLVLHALQTAAVAVRFAATALANQAKAVHHVLRIAERAKNLTVLLVLLLPSVQVVTAFIVFVVLRKLTAGIITAMRANLALPAFPIAAPAAQFAAMGLARVENLVLLALRIAVLARRVKNQTVLIVPIQVNVLIGACTVFAAPLHLIAGTVIVMVEKFVPIALLIAGHVTNRMVLLVTFGQNVPAATVFMANAVRQRFIAATAIATAGKTVLRVLLIAAAAGRFVVTDNASRGKVVQIVLPIAARVHIKNPMAWPVIKVKNVARSIAKITFVA